NVKLKLNYSIYLESNIEDIEEQSYDHKTKIVHQFSVKIISWIIREDFFCISTVKRNSNRNSD
ncbi:MAG: hypothetical protein ACI3X7_03355, partial [Bacteroidaceae bacterium]